MRLWRGRRRGPAFRHVFLLAFSKFRAPKSAPIIDRILSLGRDAAERFPLPTPTVHRSPSFRLFAQCAYIDQTFRVPSFVDPTTIALPGQLVGIVGPNGCGQVHVIDAVRWVLAKGSSDCAASRWIDVIFNGGGERKPVARASVELVFDNASGRAAGQWSQYAELGR